MTGLKEILTMDPKNSFARYGLAMELAGRGEIEAALSEFATLLEQNPDYTAGYFMGSSSHLMNRIGYFFLWAVMG